MMDIMFLHEKFYRPLPGQFLTVSLNSVSVVISPTACFEFLCAARLILCILP